MTTPAPQVWPTLRARDAHALIDFLVTAFGFVEVVSYADGEAVAHAQLSWPPGGGVMLGSARGTPDDAWPLQPGTFGGYVVCEDVDGLFARAVAAGATVGSAPAGSSYGSRECLLIDPEGNRWSFGTYRGEPVG